MEDNDTSIDIQAEKQLFADLVDRDMEAIGAIGTANEQQFTSPEDAPMDLQAMQGSALPDSMPYEATEIHIASEAKASLAEMDIKGEFDAESKYDELSARLEEMKQSDPEKNANQWLPDPGPKDNYEETPILEQTNLIFDDRKQKFVMMPKWA